MREKEKKAQENKYVWKKLFVEFPEKNIKAVYNVISTFYGYFIFNFMMIFFSNGSGNNKQDGKNDMKNMITSSHDDTHIHTVSQRESDRERKIHNARHSSDIVQQIEEKWNENR